MKANELTRRQREVIEDLVSSDEDEIAVLKKHKVGASTYKRWLAKEVFVAELEFRLDGVRRDGERLIARKAGKAAGKLAGFLGKKDSETVRKACVDVLRLGAERKKEKKAVTKEPEVKEGAGKIDEETARKILGVLAEAKRKRKQ